jgi:hypothetical protein
MKSRMLVFLTLVVLTTGMALAQDQYVAYSVYYYNSSGTGFGMAGNIVDTGGTSSSAIKAYPDMATELNGVALNGDPIVQGFPESNGDPGIDLTDYTGSSGQPVAIYNANATGGTLNKTITGGWPNVVNLYDLVPVGSYVYAIDYDNARVVEISPSTFTQTASTPYSAPSVTVGNYTYKAYGQQLLNVNGTLYALFSYWIYNSSTGTFTYTNSALAKLNISPGKSITLSSANVAFGANGFAMASTTIGSTPYIYVASLGGPIEGSTYNSNSEIQAVSVNNFTATPTQVLTTATYPYNFYDISFNGSTVYILMATYTGDFAATNGLLLQGTVSSSNAPNFTGTYSTLDTISAAPGYYWTAQYVSGDNRIWEGRGNDIWAFNASTKKPLAKLTFSASDPFGSTGLLISSGDPYNTLSGFSYVDPVSKKSVTARGYRSPFQVSRSSELAPAQAILQGRPGLTQEELKQLNQEFVTK